MKLRRLTDRLTIYNWFVASIIIVTAIYNIQREAPISLRMIVLQLALLAIQSIILIWGCRAFDKRHQFSVKVSKAICKSLDTNIVPTSKAIEDYRETLRREYAKRS